MSHRPSKTARFEADVIAKNFAHEDTKLLVKFKNKLPKRLQWIAKWADRAGFRNPMELYAGISEAMKRPYYAQSLVGLTQDQFIKTNAFLLKRMSSADPHSIGAMLQGSHIPRPPGRRGTRPHVGDQPTRNVSHAQTPTATNEGPSRWPQESFGSTVNNITQPPEPQQSSTNVTPEGQVIQEALSRHSNELESMFTTLKGEQAGTRQEVGNLRRAVDSIAQAVQNIQPTTVGPLEDKVSQLQGQFQSLQRELRQTSNAQERNALREDLEAIKNRLDRIEQSVQRDPQVPNITVDTSEIARKVREGMDTQTIANQLSRQLSASGVLVSDENVRQYIREVASGTQQNVQQVASQLQQSTVSAVKQALDDFQRALSQQQQAQLDALSNELNQQLQAATTSEDKERLENAVNNLQIIKNDITEAAAHLESERSAMVQGMRSLLDRKKAEIAAFVRRQLQRQGNASISQLREEVRRVMGNLDRFFRSDGEFMQAINAVATIAQRLETTQGEAQTLISNAFSGQEQAAQREQALNAVLQEALQMLQQRQENLHGTGEAHMNIDSLAVPSSSEPREQAGLILEGIKQAVQEVLQSSGISQAAELIAMQGSGQGPPGLPETAAEGTGTAVRGAGTQMTSFSGPQGQQSFSGPHHSEEGETRPPPESGETSGLPESGERSAPESGEVSAPPNRHPFEDTASNF